MSQDDPDAGAAADPVLPGPPRDALAAAQSPIATQAPVQHVERLPLAVPVRGPGNPGGVDLNDVLAAARSVAPAVSGLAARGDTLTVFSDRPPEPAELGELTSLLADSDRLTRLTRPKKAATTATDLTRVLLDDATGDQAWLRAFRRYAVTHLIPREEKAE
jgi:hypothetical protein